jgi:protoporphyrinogen oxidase
VSVAVLGAGPAGLAAAHRLATGGTDVHLYEAADAVGGLARSIELWGRPVDLGSHVFATDDEALAALWSRLAGPTPAELELRRGILTPEGILRYPPEAVDAVRAMGARRTVQSVAGLVAARWRRRRPARTAEEAVVARVGRPLYEHLFRSYAEKLWGVPCDQVDAAFATSLFGGGGGPRPLAGVVRRRPQRVVWPVDGSGAAWRRLAAELCAAGGVLHLGSPVRGVVVDGGRVRGIETAAGFAPHEHVVSSLPVPLLVRLLCPPAEDLRREAGLLRARSTVLVFLLVHHPDLFEEHWLYVGARHLRVGRITNASRWWPPGSTPASTLVCEYWCDEGDQLWAMGDDALVALAVREVREAAVDRGAPVLDASVHRLPRSHPALTLGFADRLRRLAAPLDDIDGLHRIGRHGSFTVGSMSDSMGEGITTAEALLGRDVAVVP